MKKGHLRILSWKLPDVHGRHPLWLDEVEDGKDRHNGDGSEKEKRHDLEVALSCNSKLQRRLDRSLVSACK